MAPRPFQNDTRWAGFKSWAPFLGFAQVERTGHGARLFFEPHFAIETVLDDVFARETTLSISSFITNLAEQLPVLDEGRFRLRIEGTVKVPSYSTGEHGISISLSAALRHLEQTGILRLEARSDAPTRRLLGHRARELELISHVTRGVRGVPA